MENVYYDENDDPNEENDAENDTANDTENDEFIQDELVDDAFIYIRILIGEKSNFYYLEKSSPEKLNIILEQVQNIFMTEDNARRINKFLENEKIYVISFLLNINNVLIESSAFKIPNNPASYHQPKFLKDLNEAILEMYPMCNIFYSGAKHYIYSAYQPTEKKIGQKQDYIVVLEDNTG
jgi:hypothetical protein